jgi:hypothetical protein
MLCIVTARVRCVDDCFLFLTRPQFPESREQGIDLRPAMSSTGNARHADFPADVGGQLCCRNLQTDP